MPSMLFVEWMQLLSIYWTIGNAKFSTKHKYTLKCKQILETTSIQKYTECPRTTDAIVTAKIYVLMRNLRPENPSLMNLPFLIAELLYCF